MTVLLRAKEVAKRLTVTRETVYSMNAAGQLPKPVIIGKTMRWTEASIEQWIADGGCANTEKQGASNAG